MNGLFFTGTDTGVGKTVTVAGVARLLHGQGYDVRVCKPVATGASRVGGRWLCEDTVRLAEAVGLVGKYERITRWAFPAPVAPPVAARLEGTPLALDEIVAVVRSQDRPGAVLLVEGVGGLLCPLTDDASVADLAAELGLALVVVVRRSLGTLNHTLLTLEAAAARRLPVAGVIVNETTFPEGLADKTNVAELRRRLTVPLLAVIPHQGKTVPDVAPALVGIDWWDLCHGGSPTAG